jgi:hypothetical protein
MVKTVVDILMVLGFPVPNKKSFEKYCPCPKPGPGFTMPYVKASFVAQWIDIRGGCSFC